MPVQPPTRCARAINRQLQSSRNDSLWAIECASVAALDRHATITLPFVRHGSSTPGPLESRRRGGKRHMGELSFGHMQSGMPHWSIDAVDLSNWQWKPPIPGFKLAREPREKRQKFWSAVSDWLGADQDSHMDATDNASAVKEDLAGTLGRTQPEISLPLAKGEAVLAEVAPSAVEPSTIEKGLNAITLDALMDAALTTTPHFVNFCKELRRTVEAGHLSGEALCTVVQSLSDGVEEASQKRQTHQLAERVKILKVQLLKSVVAGLEACRLGYQLDDDAVWSMLLQQASTLPIDNISLLGSIFSCLPRQVMEPARAGILANVESFLIAMGTSKFSSRNAGREHTRRMAKSLERIASSKTYMLEWITYQLCESTSLRGLATSTPRHTWLMVLARLRRVSDAHLLDACSKFDREAMGVSLSQAQILALFMARPSFYGTVKSEHVHGLRNILGRPRVKECLKKIGVAIWLKVGPDCFQSLFHFLQHLGRSQNALHMVRQLTTVVDNEVSLLANYFAQIGHPRLALEIMRKFAESRQTSQGNFWDTSYADDVLNLALRVQGIRWPKIFDHLGLNRSGGNKSTANANLVEKMAVAIMRAPHLSDTQARAAIEDCLGLLEERKVKIRPPVLRALTEIMMRDLAIGEWGRTARLVWFLRRLDRYAGPEVAHRAHQVMEQHRRQLKAGFRARPH